MLKTKDAAKLLEVSTYTINRWRREGVLLHGVHYCCYNKRTFRYYQDALERLVADGNDPEARRRYALSLLTPQSTSEEVSHEPVN